LEFSVVDDAVALYRLPQTIRDYISQALRWGRGGEQLKDIFGKKTVEKGYYVPRRFMILMMIKQIIRNPSGYAMLRIVNSYIRLKQKLDRERLDVKWETINSSKKLFMKSYSLR
jgi:hypothetical protein